MNKYFVLSAVLILGMPLNSYASGVATNTNDLLTPTLTELYNSGLSSIPSDYSLEIDPAGNYQITKYLESYGVNGNLELTPVQMSLAFNDKLGIANGDTTLYFKWGLDANNNTVLGTGTISDNDISIGVNASDNIRQEITAGTGADINNSFAGLIGATINGGAISNNADGNNSFVGNINGDFVGNNINRTSGYVYGAAIYNNAATGYVAEIGDITGSFVGNSVTGSTGGRSIIYNYGAGAKIGDITGDFINNYAITPSGSPVGTAIYNYFGEIGDITGSFIGNLASGRATSEGAAIYNFNGDLGVINSLFLNNKSTSTNGFSRGGAIQNLNSAQDVKSTTIVGINADFIGNSATSGTSRASGGAINNANDEWDKGYTASIGWIYGDFLYNSVTSLNNFALGGAIYNQMDSYIYDIRGNFVGNSVTGKDAWGGAIHNIGQLSLTDSSFFDNFAKTESGTAFGGAIYTADNFINVLFSQIPPVTNINAVGGDVYFSGNYVETGAAGSEVKTYNAIHIDGVTVNLATKNNKKIIFNDGITGAAGKTNVINVNGGSVVLNDYVSDVAINLNAGEIILGLENVYTGTGYTGTGDRSDLDILTNSQFSNVDLRMSEDTNLNLVNNVFQMIDINTLTLIDDAKISIDVDLQNGLTDALNVTNVNGNGELEIGYINMMSDSVLDKTTMNFINNPALARISEYDAYDSYAFTDLYQYAVSINQTTGDITFERGTGANKYNPVIMTSSVATNAFVLAGFDIFDEVLMDANNLNMYKNIYGIYYDGSKSNNFWFKAIGKSQDIKFSNYQDVENDTYGGIFGLDKKIHHSNGWDGVYSAYLGFMGTDLSYNAVDINQYGSVLGLRAMFEKNGWFTGTTANFTIGFTDSTNLYGTDDFDMMSFGAANKTGYNFDIHCNRYLLQPSLTLAYLYATSPDYKMSNNMDIRGDNVGVFQIKPELRAVGRFDNGWESYAALSYNWNSGADMDVYLDNVLLPELEMGSYMEYKLGVMKSLSSNWDGYAEISTTSGSVHGYSLQVGFDMKF